MTKKLTLNISSTTSAQSVCATTTASKPAHTHTHTHTYTNTQLSNDAPRPKEEYSVRYRNMALVHLTELGRQLAERNMRRVV